VRIGLALLRVIVGALFVGHGLQKLLGWFGGHGPEATGEYFEAVGLRPGKEHALAAGASETLGGALLALGFLTPAAAALISGVQAAAIRTVHLPKGVWNHEGGYEYNLVLIALAVAIADVGPGALSADEALGLRLSGPGWALASLGAGLAGAAYVTRGATPPADEAAPA